MEDVVTTSKAWCERATDQLINCQLSQIPMNTPETGKNVGKYEKLQFEKTIGALWQSN
jgi:hypothetical protein